MNIIFWGTPKYCIPIFNSLINSNHKIIAVVTQPDRKRSRGKKICYSPVKEKAIEMNIPVFTPTNIKKDIEVQSQINEMKADIYVVVAFGQILPKNVLKQPKYGCWNIHASLLPRWRGAAPIQRSVIEGDKETGIAIMLMEEGLDTGPILLEKNTKIEPKVNAEELSSILSELSSEALLESLVIIQKAKDSKSKLKLTEQYKLNRNPTYANLIDKSEYLINWNSSSYEIQQKVLGLYPNAYTILENKRIKILEAIELIQSNTYINFIKEFNINEIRKSHESKAGELIGILGDEGLVIKAKTGYILIRKAKVEGKKINSGKSLIQQIMNNNKFRDVIKFKG
ncbi:methionyl-tRNA formyltransferase [Prochlorococcus marinus]|uniref:methionyl-tRNA formyltransferase n=1 Tax=Prochlorococcus marinus TaxID=1219 RepID=UPI0022B372B8|nr:methionyl-tRNA formyltransferase [Prochlorococcus marinus]